ncbi:MAG: response regulator [Deltaproteobacteria bacterium]|nr:MAG: response regulator [Deltaproteobacteria bacterium]
MKKSIRLLIIEDSEDDAELLVRKVTKSGYKIKYTRVESEKEMKSALQQEVWDLIISDYSLPNFTGLSAINLINQLNIDIPFIIVSGAIGEDIAVEAMKAGAHDYIMKDNLARLSPAIERELREAKIRNERKQAISALRESEQKYHTLFDQSPVGVFIVNKNLIITECNKRTTDIFLTPIEEIIGLDLKKINDKSLISLIKKAFKGESSQQDIHYKATDGTDKIWLYCFVSPLRNSNNEVTDAMAVLEDITERKNAEQGIQKLNINLENRVKLRTHELSNINLKLISEINQRKEVEKKLNLSLKEKEILLKEVHHRVKNNLQLISSMLSLQADTLEDKNILSVFDESQRRIQTIALVHEHLYGSEDIEHFDFSEYIESLLDNLLTAFNIHPGSIKTNLDLENIKLDIDKALPCSLIINELISNSFKHAFPDMLSSDKSSKKDNKIDIKIHQSKNSHILINIGDNGIGFPKNIDFSNTITLGLQLVCSLVDQLKGTIELSNKAGTKFTISFIS